MTRLRIARSLLKRVRNDLRRSHEFAHERVGYLFVRGSEDLLVAFDYLPLHDHEYEVQGDVGAQFSSMAIARAMLASRALGCGALHIHEHGHGGRPGFSFVDLASLQELTPAFFGVSSGPHGGVVLSHDHAIGLVWTRPGGSAQHIHEITEVGMPLSVWRNDEHA